MKVVIATIADVEAAIAVLKKAVTVDPTLEGSSGKKLAASVELILPKDGVTKDLNQAHTHAEKKWAVNFANDLDACTKGNKAEKIKQYVCSTLAYTRLIADPGVKPKVESWLAEKFPAKPEAAEAA